MTLRRAAGLTGLYPSGEIGPVRKAGLDGGSPQVIIGESASRGEKG